MSKTGVDVVLVGGGARSGTTLLHRMFGTREGYFPIGELNTIWEQYFIGNGLCGCGKPFRECELWTAIIEEAFGGVDNVDARQMIALRDSALHWRYLPLLVFPRLRPAAFQRRLSEYADTLGAIYTAIHKVSECEVILDSSKRPAHAFTLTEITGIRPNMIRLVRDSRAVAYSWQRKKRRTDVVGSEEYLGGKSKTIRGAFRWALNQTFGALAARRFPIAATYRYEDFARAPRQTLNDMADRLGLHDQVGFPFVSDNAIDLGTHHCLWGNPNRLDRGVVTIRPDMEWTEKMPLSQKLQIGLVTFPWLLAYRYIGFGERKITPGTSALGLDER